MKHSYLSLLMVLLLFIQAPQLLGDDKTGEIKSLIKIAEMKLEKLKKIGAKSYASEEIAKITKAIKDANAAIKAGNEEKALLIISIGLAYFKKVDANKELIEAENELNQARSRHNQKKESEQ